MKQQLNRLKCAVIAALTMGFAGSALAAHTHCVCGDGACTAEGHTCSPITWTAWTQTTTLPTTAGNYYLANDVTLTETYQPIDGVNLCLNGHVVKPGTTGKTVITVIQGRTFTMTDCDSTAVHNFKVGEDGLWTLTSDTKDVDFEDLTARPAAGTVVAVKGGVITGASGSDKRGIDVSGTNNLYHVNVIGNHASDTGNNNNGAGVYAHDGGVLNGEGCRICGNVAKKSGGGVQNHSTVNLRNSKLSFNKCSSYGGGLGNNGSSNTETLNGTGTLTDCEIIGNEAQYGGGVHNGYKTILQGTTVIAGNTASTLGGGVSGYGYWGYEHAGQVTIDGRNVCITNNTCTDNAALNNYAQETGYAINLTGGEALGTARIGIGQFKNTSATTPIDPPVAVTAAGTGSGTATDVAYFTSDDARFVVAFNTDHLVMKIPDIKVQPTAVDNTTVVVMTNGVPVELVGGEYLVPSNSVNVKVVYTASNTCYFADGSTAKTNDVVTSTNPATLPAAPAAPTQHKHCLCGDGACTAEGHSHEDVIWKAWTATDKLPSSAGNWYLANDVTLSSTYQPPTGVNLCLNGHVVKKGGSCNKLVNVSGVVFTITDCTDTPHYFNKVFAGYQTGVWVYSLTTSPSASSICVKGGCITGGYGWSGSPTHSPCLNVVNGGTFNFYRGNLVGNCSEQIAAGMLVESGATLNMYGGNVEGNYSYWGFCNLGGTANIYKGSFRNNCGGPNGLACGGVTTIYDIEVSGNVSYGGAGGLCAAGTFTMLGGTVFGNRSTTAKGGFEIATAQATIGGNVCITGNYSNAERDGFNYSGGTINNLYLPADKTVSISTTSPLAAGAKIGVTTETKPTSAAQLVPVTSNRGEDLAHFTSDEGYLVVNEAGKVQLKFFLNVAFHANHADVTRDGAAFSSTNAVLNYGSTVGIPQLACEGLAMVGWAKTAGATEPEYTDAQVATISTESGSSHDLYAVWKATVRIPVFVAFDGLTAVPTDGREYTFKLTQRSGPSVMPATSVVTIPCPTATGDVARVGFGTNDVTNPFTVQLSTGTYVYMIEQTTTARPGEKLDTGYWLMSVEVNTAAKPYAGISSNAYAEEIDELGEDSFKVYIDSGEASFSAAQKALVFGGDTQTVIDVEAFNRAVVKSQFAIDFTKSFSIGGKVQVGAAADGSVLGFVPYSGAPDIETNQGSSLGIYGYYDDFWEYKPAQGKGIFLEFDTLGGNDSTWGDDEFDCAHFAVVTTDAEGRPAYTGKGHEFDDNYALPTGEMSYSIEFDATTKKLTFKIVDGSTVYGPWVYDDPVSQFGKNEACMLLAGAMRYGPDGSYGMGWEGDPAPKTKMTLDTFAYIMNQMAPGAVDNTFRNRQEALVTYIADGGGVFASGQATTNVFANDARYVFPKPPTRTDSYKYAGWTNALGQAISEGQPLGSIADCEAYVTWDPILVKVTVPALEHTTPTVLTNGLEIAAPYMVLSNDLVTVVYTADDGYIFPDGKMTRTHEGICASTDPTVAPVSEVRPVRDLRDYVIVDEYERNPLFEDWNPDDGTFVYDGVAYTNGVNAFRSFGDAFATESFHLATNILTFGYQTIATNVNFITDWRLTLKGYTTFSGEDVVSIVSVGTTDAGAGMSGSLVDVTNRVAAIVGEGAFVLSVTNGTPGAASYKADLEAIIGAAEIEVRYANFEPAREKETEPESGKEVTSETFVVDDQSKIEKDGTIVLPGADTDGRITVDISPTTTNDVVVAGKLQSREWDVVIVNETVQTLAVGAIETGMNVLITNMTDVGRIITLDNVVAGKNIAIDNNGHLDARVVAQDDITIRNAAINTLVGTYKAGGAINVSGECGSLSNAVIDAEGDLTVTGTNVITGPVDLKASGDLVFSGVTKTEWSVEGDNHEAMIDFTDVKDSTAFGIRVDAAQTDGDVVGVYTIASNATTAAGKSFALAGGSVSTTIAVAAANAAEVEAKTLYIGAKAYSLYRDANGALVFEVKWGKFAITYDAMGPYFTAGETTVVSDSYVHIGYALPTAPVRAGYTFLGWYDGVTNGAPVAVSGSSLLYIREHTVFARWQANGSAPTAALSLAADGTVTPSGNVGNNLVLPDTIDGKPVLMIGKAAFAAANYKASSITNLVTGVFLRSIEPGAFNQVTMLKTLKITEARDFDNPSTVVPVTIGKRAFAGTRIESLEIAEGTIIGEQAFRGCSYLKEIAFFGDAANASLTAANVDAFTLCGYANGTGKIKLYMSDAFNAANAAFVTALKNSYAASNVEIEDIAGYSPATSVSISGLDVSQPTEMSLRVSADALIKGTFAYVSKIKILYRENLADAEREYDPTSVVQNPDGTYTLKFVAPNAGRNGFMRVEVR